MKQQCNASLEAFSTRTLRISPAVVVSWHYRQFQKKISSISLLKIFHALQNIAFCQNVYFAKRALLRQRAKHGTTIQRKCLVPPPRGCNKLHQIGRPR